MILPCGDIQREVAISKDELSFKFKMVAHGLLFVERFYCECALAAGLRRGGKRH